MSSPPAPLLAALAALLLACSPLPAEDLKLTPPEAEAKTEAQMRPYKQAIPGADVAFEMVPIKGGEFVMGSPESEPGRNEDEGPQHKVRVEPFWIGGPTVRARVSAALPAWIRRVSSDMRGCGSSRRWRKCFRS